MKILHTGDWHLGKYLEGNSRLKEQKKFLDDFVDILEENKIQMVIISGDVYDNSNPPAEAEKLFYKALKEISKDGERIVLIIAGNHDNPDRLAAANPLAFEQGVIIVDKPNNKIEVGNCGKHTVIESESGYFKINIDGEVASIITLPYPSEKRLNEVLSIDLEDKEAFKGYSDRIKLFFDERKDRFTDDTVNIVVSHLFVIGGEESGSERAIQLGGTYGVRASCFPKNADYVALGHLHGLQKIKSDVNVYYAGSPIQYSKSEANQSKGCIVIDVGSNRKAIIEKIFFKNYKAIDIWRCKNVDEAIYKCENNKDRESWVYLEIETDRIIEQEEIKLMKSYKSDIIEIKPILRENNKDDLDEFISQDKNIEELFRDFFIDKNNVEPKNELIETFIEIVYKKEADINETNEVED